MNTNSLGGKITIKEYARRCGKDHSYLLKKCRAGKFKTAVKIGSQWFIDENELYTDLRVKSGGYIGFSSKTSSNVDQKKYGPHNSSFNDILSFKNSHPEATISDVAKSLGLSTATVSKWWKSVIELSNPKK